MSSPNAFMIGGGIASLAAAVFMIRDTGWNGERIHILERSSVLGGSLDGAGSPEQGYIIRGGRMFERHFGCTYDLLNSIPTLQDPSLSVTQEIQAFTQSTLTSSSCRLVDSGERIEAPAFGLSAADRVRMVMLSQRSERSLGDIAISDYFSDNFLTTNFWTMWCTMFAFQAWHSAAEFRRYMRRFMHLLPGFNRLEGIHRTRLNQYDSIVAPVVRWLEQQGVHFHLNASVCDITFDDDLANITALEHVSSGETRRQDVAKQDRVFITLGSMTEASTVGSMSTAPALSTEPCESGSWALWRNISHVSVEFGTPDTFCSDIERTQWTSFTVTLHDPAFFEHMEKFTHNPAGTGGLVTFKNSGWLLSVVLAHQPHFANQPEDTWVFWGYGLHSQCNGDAVTKPMAECTGAEILQELVHHLPVHDPGELASKMFATANCIPCSMPYITAQFMPRTKGSRPAVIPGGSNNFAFLGQFVELPEDTAFTVEYSVRSAQVAVHGLSGTSRAITPIYRGFSDPGVVYRALKTIATNAT